MGKIISNDVVVFKGNESSYLYSTNDSGKIIYRDKIDTIIGIKHPGIILGMDVWGTIWVIHNHYEIGYTEIVTIDNFALNSPIFYDERPVFYDTNQITQRAINHWFTKKEYSWLFNNCQHFINKVVQNNNHSETIERVSDNAMMVGGILTLLGLLQAMGI